MKTLVRRMVKLVEMKMTSKKKRFKAKSKKQTMTRKQNFTE